MKFLVINGPNLNLLGLREPAIYGKESYDELVALINRVCRDEGIFVSVFQSNHEGTIVDKIQDAYGHYDGIVINPAAYTHTSVAIMDALKAVSIPTIEVHLSDIHSREDFRKVSITGLAAMKTICGLGFEGYRKAIIELKEHLLGQTAQ